MTDQIVLQFSTAAPAKFPWVFVPFTRHSENRASWAIRCLGHSYFSHVDFKVDVETFAQWIGASVDVAREKFGEYALLGASNNPSSPIIVGNPRGVALRPSEYQSFGVRRQMVLRTDRADEILECARTQIGKPFDGSALSPKVFLSDPFYGAVESRDWRNPDKWFCAEMAVCNLEDGGFWGVGETVPIKKNRVTPEDLHLVLVMDPRVMNRDTHLLPIPTLKMGIYEQ